MECKGNIFFYLTTNSLQNNEIDPNKYTKKKDLWNHFDVPTKQSGKSCLNIHIRIAIQKHLATNKSAGFTITKY